MPLVLESLRDAVAALERVVAVSDDTDFMDSVSEPVRDAVRSGVIQNFEVAYELCWKFMRRWLATNVGRTQVEGVTRRHLFRLAAEQRLIDDVEQWMRYHDARNRTSHTYSLATAREVYAIACEFTSAAKDLLERLESRND